MIVLAFMITGSMMEEILSQISLVEEMKLSMAAGWLSQFILLSWDRFKAKGFAVDEVSTAG